MGSSYPKISATSPARITVFRDAQAKRDGKDLEFRSLAELAEWLPDDPPRIKVKKRTKLYTRGRTSARRSVRLRKSTRPLKKLGF